MEHNTWNIGWMGRNVLCRKKHQQGDNPCANWYICPPKVLAHSSIPDRSVHSQLRLGSTSSRKSQISGSFVNDHMTDNRCDPLQYIAFEHRLIRSGCGSGSMWVRHIYSAVSCLGHSAESPEARATFSARPSAKPKVLHMSMNATVDQPPPTHVRNPPSGSFQISMYLT